MKEVGSRARQVLGNSVGTEGMASTARLACLGELGRLVSLRWSLQERVIGEVREVVGGQSLKGLVDHCEAFWLLL